MPSHQPLSMRSGPDFNSSRSFWHGMGLGSNHSGRWSLLGETDSSPVSQCRHASSGLWSAAGAMLKTASFPKRMRSRSSNRLASPFPALSWNMSRFDTVSYTHLRAHETRHDLV